MNTIPGIVRGFAIEDKADQWHLTCKLCRARWSIPKGKPAPGNVLKLLNHAAGCRKKAHTKNRSTLDAFFGGLS